MGKLIKLSLKSLILFVVNALLSPQMVAMAAMNGKNRGRNISKINILNISQHGIWLYVKAKEYFLPYAQFPWFRKATIDEIQDVQFVHAHHLHWPALDVDLELESLDNFEKYSLLYH